MREYTIYPAFLNSQQAPMDASYPNDGHVMRVASGLSTGLGERAREQQAQHSLSTMVNSTAQDTLSLGQKQRALGGDNMNERITATETRLVAIPTRDVDRVAKAWDNLFVRGELTDRTTMMLRNKHLHATPTSTTQRDGDDGVPSDEDLERMLGDQLVKATKWLDIVGLVAAQLVVDYHTGSIFFRVVPATELEIFISVNQRTRARTFMARKRLTAEDMAEARSTARATRGDLNTIINDIRKKHPRYAVWPSISTPPNLQGGLTSRVAGIIDALETVLRIEGAVVENIVSPTMISIQRGRTDLQGVEQTQALDDDLDDALMGAFETAVDEVNQHPITGNTIDGIDLSNVNDESLRTQGGARTRLADRLAQAAEKRSERELERQQRGAPHPLHMNSLGAPLRVQSAMEMERARVERELKMSMAAVKQGGRHAVPLPSDASITVVEPRTELPGRWFHDMLMDRIRKTLGGETVHERSTSSGNTSVNALVAHTRASSQRAALTKDLTMILTDMMRTANEFAIFRNELHASSTTAIKRESLKTIALRDALSRITTPEHMQTLDTMATRLNERGRNVHLDRRIIDDDLYTAEQRMLAGHFDTDIDAQSAARIRQRRRKRRASESDKPRDDVHKDEQVLEEKRVKFSADDQQTDVKAIKEGDHRAKKRKIGEVEVAPPSVTVNPPFHVYKDYRIELVFEPDPLPPLLGGGPLTSTDDTQKETTTSVTSIPLGKGTAEMVAIGQVEM